MALIDRIKDGLGNIIHPITSTKAIYDAQGDRLDNIIASLDRRVLVWTNPSPTSSIVEGTVIPIDLTNYEEIEVVYNDRDNQITRGTFIGQVGYSLTLNKTSGSVCQYRTIAITTTGITCSSCSSINFSTMTTTTTDKYMVPVKIYGIRKVE